MTAPVFIADIAEEHSVLSASKVPIPMGLAGAEIGCSIELRGEEARHATVVRRIKKGEAIDIVDGKGCRYSGEVTDLSGKDRLVMRIAHIEKHTPRSPRLTLVQALAKGGRDEQAVENATEIGVQTIIPWQAERCVSTWKEEKTRKGQRKWQRIAREATKQSRQAIVPDVHTVLDTAGLADYLRAALGAKIILLHEEAQRSLSRELRTLAGREQIAEVIVIVGPEGGIGEKEESCLCFAGAEKLRLGTSVLRSSSAGPAALAVLCAVSGKWD